MSRSGYSDELDDWDTIRWRGRVASSIRGKRGQKLLVDLLAALEAMPEKALIIGELKTEDGEVCALGALAVVRGIDLEAVDPDEPEAVAAVFDIAPCLAQEIAYMNDEYFDSYTAKTAKDRWMGMRAWVAAQIKSPVAEATA